ncbi:MAG TPA: DJ-1/PfpI family protein [archaeon]|nr:DJ-1/PfpI family protein [archaeon]HLD81293.1 DJ-1/PfpI family protein [archaeon]
MSVEGKNVLFVVAPTNFRDEELFVPKELLEKAGASITVACNKVLPAKGMMGGQVVPDVELKNVNAEDYDAIVFVGGNGAEIYFDNAQAHNVAKAAVNAGKVVCAICVAPSILANAGLLEGKKATVFFGTKYQDNLKARGAIYTGGKVVVDGNIITANGPMAAKEFGEEIIRALS